MLAGAEELCTGSDPAASSAAGATADTARPARARAGDQALTRSLRAGQARWRDSSGLGCGLGRISASRASATGSRLTPCGVVPSVDTNGKTPRAPMSPGLPPPWPGTLGTSARLSTGSNSAYRALGRELLAIGNAAFRTDHHAASTKSAWNQRRAAERTRVSQRGFA